MKITKREANLVLAGLRSIEREARSDEPSIAHEKEFQDFMSRVWRYTKDV